MLCVKTQVLPSPIHGLGVFADEDIRAGTIIWKFTPGFDLKFTKQQIDAFPAPVKAYLDTYAWLSKKSGRYCFSSDNGKYFNHSENPNALSAYYPDEEEVITKAVRDIRRGEEITDSYGSFEQNFSKDWE